MTREAYEIFLLPIEMEKLSKQYPSVKLVTVHMPFQYPTTHKNLPKNRISGMEGTSALFNLTVTCNELIQNGESLLSLQYDTILRTRLDGFWRKTPESLPIYFPNLLEGSYSLSQISLIEKASQRTRTKPTSSLQKIQPNPLIGFPFVYVSQRYSYGGINDRFAIGPRDLMLKANNRFENVETVVVRQPNATLRNSETSLLHEFQVSNITSYLLGCQTNKNGKTPPGHPCPFPFCLLRPQMTQRFPTEGQPWKISDGGKCFLGHRTQKVGCRSVEGLRNVRRAPSFSLSFSFAFSLF